MRIAPVLAVTFLVACHHPAPRPPAMHPTGAMSEEDFKALHQLRDDHSPAATGEMIELAGARAYLSLPPGAHGPLPGIVLVHEWWGLNEHIEHWADRLAQLGFAALAVDLYGGQVATTPDDAMKIMQGVQEDEAKRILSAAIAYLADDPRIQAPRRAVIGWCFGGGWSLETAIEHPELDAAVMYYGSPETDPGRLAQVHARLLGVFANQDANITPDVVDGFEKALEEAGVDAQILRYDAEHGFANPSGAHYDEADARDAWEHVVAFLLELQR
jgi:carboxymethylenebutenolidase